MSKIKWLCALEYVLVVNSRIVPSVMDIKTSEGVELFRKCVRVCAQSHMHAVDIHGEQARLVFWGR
jgi:hypothetical protein